MRALAVPGFVALVSGDVNDNDADDDCDGGDDGDGDKDDCHDGDTCRGDGGNDDD